MRTILNIAIFIVAVFGFGLAVGYKANKKVITVEVEIVKPMSIGQTQEILKELGHYKGRIDGIWGKETDKAFCSYSAEECFKKIGETK